MASVVGGFVMPHEPGIFFAPPGNEDADLSRVRAAYAHIAQRIGELEATSAIVIGADHYVLFGPGCLPAYLIGMGTVLGPYERFPGIEQGEIPSHPRLARQLFEFGRREGFDWAVAKHLRVDHSIGLPSRVCVLPNASVKGIVPIYLASGVEPLLPMRRAYELGQMMCRAIAAWDTQERIVVIGSGGLSHWVGMREMGQVNEGFDRWVLDVITRGDVEALLTLEDDQLVKSAGNGALELRSFACAMGVLPGARGRVIAYEHCSRWVAGLGFAELYSAALAEASA